MTKSALIPAKKIEDSILLIRGERVILDYQIAALYAVPTKALNLAVKRNVRRFPEDFMFRLTAREFAVVRRLLRFQNETSNEGGRGGRRHFPHAFTEQGVAMLSSVLRSDRAIHVNIAIIRAFVNLRNIFSSNRELEAKLKVVELKLERHDADIQSIFEAIRRLMAQPAPPRRRIGF